MSLIISRKGFVSFLIYRRFGKSGFVFLTGLEEARGEDLQLPYGNKEGLKGRENLGFSKSN